MTQRVNFFNLFKINQDGSIEPLRLIRIGGIQFGPGVRFGKGVLFAGIDLSQYIGRDFQVQIDQSEIVTIMGIY